MKAFEVKVVGSRYYSYTFGTSLGVWFKNYTTAWEYARVQWMNAMYA